jgi:hypothetical protein
MKTALSGLFAAVIFCTAAVASEPGTPLRRIGQHNRACLRPGQHLRAWLRQIRITSARKGGRTARRLHLHSHSFRRNIRKILRRTSGGVFDDLRRLLSHLSVKLPVAGRRRTSPVHELPVPRRKKLRPIESHTACDHALRSARRPTSQAMPAAIAIKADRTSAPIATGAARASERSGSSVAGNSPTENEPPNSSGLSTCR